MPPATMRTSGFSQRISTRMVLAGAALLASASMAAARGGSSLYPGRPASTDDPVSGSLPGGGPDRRGDEVAMAVTRLPEAGDMPVVLPRPLSSEMAQLVRSIFRLQRQGAFAEALSSSTRLTDTTLLGDIMAERYLNPAYLPTAQELQLWLKEHSDMADAPAVWARLAGMRNHGALPVEPSKTMLHPDNSGLLADMGDARALHRNPLLDRTVAERAGHGVSGAESALGLIARTPGMTPLYASQLRGEIARQLLSSGHAEEALQIGKVGLDHGTQVSGEQAYVAGLAAWAQKQPRQAVVFFEKASAMSNTTPALRAAAAFWAARVHRAQGEESVWRPWMRRAAAVPHSFYGMLASQVLEQAPKHRTISAFHLMDMEGGDSPAFVSPVISEIDIEAVKISPIGTRFFALLQVGEMQRAEDALRRYWPRLGNDPAMARSVQLVAAAAGMTELALQMSDSLATEHDGRKQVLALPSLHPRHGFTVDPALVYALTRLESNFNPHAVSGAGAHGLMQLRAVTAGFVTGNTARFQSSPEALYDPGLNLDIGQGYLRYLAQLNHQVHPDGPVGGDMIRILAGYNAGPNAITRWEKAGGGHEDPLLYLELLPNTQTRAYVVQALNTLWYYAKRLNLPTPSLDALSAGEWPAFEEEIALAGHRRHLAMLH